MDPFFPSPYNSSGFVTFCGQWEWEEGLSFFFLILFSYVSYAYWSANDKIRSGQIYTTWDLGRNLSQKIRWERWLILEILNYCFIFSLLSLIFDVDSDLSIPSVIFRSEKKFCLFSDLCSARYRAIICLVTWPQKDLLPCSWEGFTVDTFSIPLKWHDEDWTQKTLCMLIITIKVVLFQKQLEIWVWSSGEAGDAFLIVIGTWSHWCWWGCLGNGMESVEKSYPFYHCGQINFVPLASA